jgi:hypothetical protein
MTDTEVQMSNEKIQDELTSILKECVTTGTFWNRHFQVDDTIDIWRESNRVLMRHDQEPVSFDVFYIALQQFRRGYGKDFGEAVGQFILTLGSRNEIALEEKPTRRRRAGGVKAPRATRLDRSGTGSVKVNGSFASRVGSM